MAQQGRASDRRASDVGGGPSGGQRPMPAGLRLALLAGVALLLGGALYLIVARGEALLAALWGLASLCF